MKSLPFPLGYRMMLTVAIAVAAGRAHAQEVRVLRAGPDGAVQSFSVPAGAQPSPPAQPVQPAAQPGEKPDGKKPGDEKKKVDDAKPETAKEPDIIKRPIEPPQPPNPSELEVRPNAAGKLSLNFHGQKWQGVLTWLKVVSAVNLDWQELPGGYLNLTTHKEYTVPEARNIINMHLLARGFTILLRDDMMTVVNVKKMNPALVPRIRPEQLKERDDFEFVKVSFPLRSLLATEAAEEAKSMLSTNHKLTPLKTTNRLEIIDAVINLREVHDFLEQEQSSEADEATVRPFYLKHARAEEVAESLKELLGLKKTAAPMTPQQMQQMQQMMAQQAKKGGAAAGKQPEVHIVAMPKENAILVHAPPDKLAIVEEAVEILDHQPGYAQSMVASVTETEVYRLENLDPATFIETLREMGGLSPRTRIQSDAKRKAIVVTGSEKDQFVVEMLIRKLDSSSRSFHVIALRRHDAEYVAGSIRFMLGKEKDEKQSQPSRSYFSFRYGQQQQEEDDDDFRVDADIEYNRLLMWCNDLELRSVQNLLVELGEFPKPGGNTARRRMLEVGTAEDAVKLLERLQKIWPSRGNNVLDVGPLPEIQKEEKDDAPIGPVSPDKIETPNTTPAKTAADLKNKTAYRDDRSIPSAPITRSIFRLLSDEVSSGPDGAGSDEAESQRQGANAGSQPRSESPAAPETATDASLDLQKPPASGTQQPSGSALESLDDQQKKRLQELLQQFRARQQMGNPSPQGAEPTEPAPIRIQVGADGRIYLESNDTRALDALEDLLMEHAPPKRDWKVFELKYPNTWAYGVELILRDVFKEEIEAAEEGGGVQYSPFLGYYPGSSSGGGPARMSRRKPLKIISDRDSHTILVQGATPDQLHMIEELIAVYDKPQSTEAHSIRKTKVIPIKYSKAKVIAEAVKDVYRDLLSENDRALQNKESNKKEERPSGQSYTYIYGGGGAAGEGQEQEQPIRFKGLLSVGVDELSNNLIVSATEGLLDNVSMIVTALDEAAAPNSAVQVMQIDPRVNALLLQQKLKSIFGPKPPPQNNQNKNQQNQQQNQNGGQPQANVLFNGG